MFSQPQDSPTLQEQLLLQHNVAVSGQHSTMVERKEILE